MNIRPKNGRLHLLSNLTFSGKELSVESQIRIISP